MTGLLFWLAVGAANYAQFAARGNALLFMRPKRREGSELVPGLFEAAFFVLAWPVQLAFFLFTRIALPAIDRLKKELAK